MVYTEEQLKEMSDHDINLAVAKKNFNDGREVYEVEILPGLNVVRVSLDTPGVICASLGDRVFDPCNNWNDVIPIAEKYKINIGFTTFKSASDSNGNNSLTPNTKLAICEVFLMMDI